jgi:hypothetical protein
MSNYVKTTDFAAKDALPSGNPAKVAQGTQVDTEFNNIATAVATKEDTANKGVANGYASLDSSGDVPDGQISADFPRLSSSNTFTGGTQTISAIAATIRLNETDAAANNRLWDIFVNAEQLAHRVVDDAISSGVGYLTVNRTANTVDSIALAATTVTVNGQDVRNTAILNAGTLADARVAQSNVTQHQAALTIAETQITDGSLLARLAANESVTGNWTFTGNHIVQNAAPFLRLVETGVTANNTVWDFLVDAEQLVGRVVNDAISTSANWIAVNRTANTVDSINLTATTVQINGTSVNDAASITAGTLAVARGGTGTTTSTGTGSTVLSASPTFTGTVTAATLNATTLQQGGVGVSVSGHAHSAADITSGILSLARGGTNNTTGSGINVTGKVGVTKTLSTSAPSGGGDGDIWYRY